MQRMIDLGVAEKENLRQQMQQEIDRLMTENGK